MPTETRYCKPGATVSTLDKATGQPRVLLTINADTPLWIPGDDIQYVVTPDGLPPAAPPPPAPIPPPAPPPTFVPPAGMSVVKVKTGVGKLALASNTCYISDGTGRAKVSGAGTILTCPNNVKNVLVKGLDLVSSSATEDCVRIVADGLDGITFDDLGIVGGRDNVVIQATNIFGPNTIKNLTIRGCRLVDPLGTVDRSGQNLFVDNVDGLTIEGNFLINAGFRHPKRSIYTHAMYIKEGNRHVAVKDNFIVNPEAVGIQARGPLAVYTDPLNGDPGHSVTGNVIYKAVIGIMGNGPLGTFADNVIAVGPHAHDVNGGGESGLYLSVGQATSRNNLVVHSPVVDTGTPTFPPFNNAPRSDVTVLPNGTKRQWGWSNKCAYAVDQNNVARKDVTVNLDDLVTRGRNGESVAGFVAEAQKRVRAAAGVN